VCLIELELTLDPSIFFINYDYFNKIFNFLNEIPLSDLLLHHEILFSVQSVHNHRLRKVINRSEFFSREGTFYVWMFG
jgi:hypothetical protein